MTLKYIKKIPLNWIAILFFGTCFSLILLFDRLQQFPNPDYAFKAWLFIFCYPFSLGYYLYNWFKYTRLPTTFLIEHDSLIIITPDKAQNKYEYNQIDKLTIYKKSDRYSIYVKVNPAVIIKSGFIYESTQKIKHLTNHESFELIEYESFEKIETFTLKNTGKKMVRKDGTDTYL